MSNMFLRGSFFLPRIYFLQDERYKKPCIMFKADCKVRVVKGCMERQEAEGWPKEAADPKEQPLMFNHLIMKSPFSSKTRMGCASPKI